MFDAEELANNIFNEAIAQKAKHLWVEPQKDYLRVRVGENTIKEIRHLPKDLEALTKIRPSAPPQ